MAPENRERYTLKNNQEMASMGPGPDGPGKRLSDYCRRKTELASMGPGPDGPGKRQAIQPGAGDRNRFNGAGAGWPRKTSQKIIAEKIGIKRFNGAGAGWPRKTDVEAMEAIGAYELQWGRGRMAPENKACRNLDFTRRKASMGPGPDGPGKHR